MNRLGGVIGTLKFVLKFGVYIMAIVKIIEFAIETLDAIEPKQETQKLKENE